MKRVLLTVAVALLIPSILMAAPATLGVYFEGGLTYTPVPFEHFKAGLYIVQSEYYMTGVEYQMIITGPGLLLLQSVDYPPTEVLNIGDPLTGQAITFWPPLTGYPDGYDLLAIYDFVLASECIDSQNTMITLGPHPDSGELRGTYAPDNDTFDIVPLTSYICPEGVATEEESWGAIKSMYR